MTFQLINPEIKLALLVGFAVGTGAALIVHKLEGGDGIFETSLSLRGALQNLAFYAVVFGLIAVARSGLFRR